MSDLRTILGDKYDDTIEKAREVLDGFDTDYLGCGCCANYDYDEAVKRTGHDERAYMAAHDTLAAVLPDLLAEANTRAEAAEAKLEAVRALHASSGNEQSQGYDAEGNYGYISPYCVGCEAFDEYAVAWPCATIRAVDGTEEAGA